MLLLAWKDEVLEEPLLRGLLDLQEAPTVRRQRQRLLEEVVPVSAKAPLQLACTGSAVSSTPPPSTSSHPPSTHKKRGTN